MDGEPTGFGVDWKLFFNQLFALEIKKEHVLTCSDQHGAERLDELLRAYALYAPGTFNDAIEATSSARTSLDAYAARVAFYEKSHNRRVISDLDLRRCLGPGLRAAPEVRAFLEELWQNKNRPISEGESFFDSSEGKNALQALSADGGESEQEVALVFVPGFAGHTIKFALFEEMIRDINVFHGRPQDRPLLREDGIDLEFEPHSTFYARGDGGAGPFDIIQPAGGELGNTTGRNVETTEALHRWINDLPPGYANKKLIMLGYSKGAPIVLDLVHRYPELSSRIIGYVSLFGVIQGAYVARLLGERVQNLLRDVPVGEFLDTLREEEPSSIGRYLSPLFADLDLSWLSVPRIRAVFEMLGYDIGPLEKQIDRVIGGREVREVLDGAQDLLPVESARWCLRHLCNDTFRDPVFLMNVSALTDVQDFVRPVGLRRGEPGGGSLLAPMLTDEGTLDWTRLSLDALFLYVTSMEGFKTAPGGLFDTQVELGSTKSPMLDQRPLCESLTDDEVEDLFGDEELAGLWKRLGIESAQDLGERPRRELFPEQLCDNINAIDLGEIKAHHWSVFVQALRPPPELSDEHARWDFPRKAFMRALIQLLGFHNLARTCRRPRPSMIAALDLPRKEEPSEGGEEYLDAVLFRSDGVGDARKEIRNLYNLFSRAATHGIVVNSSRTGLGTEPSHGPALRTESLYFQALRIYSAADAEFREGLLDDPSVRPLPRSFIGIAGRFSRSFVSSLPDESLPRLDQARRALKVLAPGLKPFELRPLAPADFEIDDVTGRVAFAPAIRKNLWNGTADRLAAMAGCVYDPDADVSVETRLESMLGAFAPLSTVYSASFDPDDPEKSTTRLALYLPLYHVLRAENLDDPSTWYLDRGLPNMRLPRRVKLPAAELTHIRYLQEANPAKTQAIKVEMVRDYESPEDVTTIVSFGCLFDRSVDELFGFDTADYRDALHVVFRPWLAREDRDTPADRRLKDTFNKVFSLFEIEARIHVVTLRSHQKEGLLRPRFSMPESRISFRVHRYVDTAREHIPLQAAGFTCRETSGGPQRFHCWRDFWTWDHLRDEFFYGQSAGSDKGRLPTPLRGRLIGQLVGTATRAVVDRGIETIESAIDDEIGNIVDDWLKRYSTAREVLVDRLHDGIFRAEPEDAE